jgi:hypothetical protein
MKALNDPRDWSGCSTIDTKTYKALLRVANAAKKIRPFLPGWEDRCTSLFRASDRLEKLRKK